MDPQDLLLTALRASLIYFFLLLVIRLLGKRSVGSTSAFDLLVALMLGEIVDEAIYGDVAIPKALLAIAVIALWHFINAYASHKSDAVEKITSGEPAELVKNGEIQQDALARERLNPAEVFAELRLLGIDDIKEVKKATLETNGMVSAIKEDWAETVQKMDLPDKKKGGK